MRNFDFKCLLQCILGPNVFRIHHSLPVSELAYDYVPSPSEQHVNKIFSIVKTAKNILYYTIPAWTVFLYSRGFFTVTYGTVFLKYSIWFAVFYLGLMFIRGLARSNNQEYLDFIIMLEETKRGGDPARKRKYDFEYSHWPVDYTWEQGGDKEKPLDTPPYHLIGRLQKIIEGGSSAWLLFQGLPCELLSYVISHGFGLSMVYPGSTSVLNALIGPALHDARNKMIEEHKAKRAKLLARDGNIIDTIFVDRRVYGGDFSQVAPTFGGTLVVGCEGNAGYYEVGVITTPLEVGYSVLGWNHPGFGYSTGSPSPAAEINAIDAVMRYAFHLGFMPEDVILFGWSIGAFTAIHGASLNPDVGALFLDATFDDIVPLAAKAMPPLFEGIVRRTMRGYINLHHSEIIKNYSGPVRFVRREMDEVMNKDGQRIISSNCGNPLLYKFLLHRFPMIFGTSEEERALIKFALDGWLEKEDNVLRMNFMSSYGVKERKCEAMLKSYIENNSPYYPIEIGEDFSLEAKQQLVLYLASQHMSYFQSSHCPPLPGVLLVKPWDVEKDLENVQAMQESSECSSDDFEIINGALTL